MNVQCITNKVANMEVFLNKINPELLCLTEHWCRADNVDMVCLRGYRLISHFCRQGCKNGGSAVYVKENVKFGVKGLSCKKFSVEEHFECCAARIQFEKCKYVLVCAYRPPDGDMEIFLSRAFEAMSHFSKQADKVYFCGDFNVDYLVASSRRNYFRDLLDSLNLKVTSTEPTRIVVRPDGTVCATKLDYLVTNSDLTVTETNVVQANMGDHLAIVHTVYSSTHAGSEKFPTVMYRNLSTSNLNMLRSFIANLDFGRVYAIAGDVDAAYDELISTLAWAIDCVCPLKSKTIVSQKCKSQWLTRQVIDASEELRELFWLAKNLKDVHVYNLYRNKKKSYKVLLENTKKSYHSNIITASKDKSKTVWKLVNEGLGRSKRREEIVLSHDNEDVSKPSDVAQIFADYFCNITETSIQRRFGANRSHTCTLSNSVIEKTFFFYPTCETEVMAVINRLKNKNSTGCDGISIKVIKKLQDVLAGPLVYVINLIFEKASFPQALKRGLILPVRKKSGRGGVDDYRPITLLNTVSKVIEKVILGRMVDFLDKYEILSDNQHGFRPDRSTESAACEFIKSMFSALDKGEYAAGLFFDLSRAFDCLNIEFVLAKLSRVGFRGHALKLLRSYLTDRTNCVKIGSVFSRNFDVITGVPQGSVLGPLVFLIFINDLSDYMSKDVSIISFADDTSMVVTARTPEELRAKVAQTIHEFDEWCHRNNLILNLDKTNYIHFRPKIDKVAIVTQLRPSPMARFLGLCLDEHLCWEAHIEFVANKINSGIFAISQLMSTHEKHALLNVYYSLVYSHLSYIVVLWGNSTNSNRIFIAQKRAVRLIYGIRSRDSCRPVFVENKLLTFPCIYIYRTLLYIKKNIHSFETNATYHGYNTRHADMLLTERHHLSLYEKSPNYSGKKMYNRLPDHIKSLDYRRFKFKLKEYLIGKCYYSVKEFFEDSIGRQA